jgi:hypothetical protein
MNNVSMIKPHLPTQKPAQQRVAFSGQQGDGTVKIGQKEIKNEVLSDAVDAAQQVAGKITKEPDEGTIVAGFAAIATVIGLFVTKNAPKIKAFIDKSSKSNNKVIKAVGVVAGALLSFLSVIGATKLFKDKFGEQGENPTKPAPEVKVEKPAPQQAEDIKEAKEPPVAKDKEIETKEAPPEASGENPPEEK